MIKETPESVDLDITSNDAGGIKCFDKPEVTEPVIDNIIKKAQDEGDKLK